MKTIKFNVQFEVPGDVTDEQLHEDLCTVLHEGEVSKVAYVDVGLPEEEPTFNVNVDIRTWDNRDMGETWLWLDEVRYVKVNPFDMIENAVENCMGWIVEEEGLTKEEVNNALKVLKRASSR